MKLAFFFSAVVLALHLGYPAFSSESAGNCDLAKEVFETGREAQPNDTLILFLDALQTNPGCRRDLLISAVEGAKSDPSLLEQIIFVARQQFPADQSLLAEAALLAAPEMAEVIREAFFAPEELAEESLEMASQFLHPGLVILPTEAAEIDDDIREAIARMTAKVDGKIWPEQDVGESALHFKQPDEIRISRDAAAADEGSLENGLPVDMADERLVTAESVVIADNWEPSEAIRLDESKFVSDDETDTREAREARKKSIAPAGTVELPRRPVLSRSSVYYIPSSEERSRSTIDQDEEERPTLVIRSAPSAPTTPK